MTQNERESHYKKTVILVQVFTDMRWPYFNVFGRFYFCECNVHESKPLAVFGPEHDVQSDAGLYLNSFDMLSDSIYRKKKQKKKKESFSHTAFIDISFSFMFQLQGAHTTAVYSQMVRSFQRLNRASTANASIRI